MIAYMTSHPMRLLLVVAALLGVASGAGVFVPAAGNARNLNGDLQHRQYVQITPRCQADANPFDIVNVTVSIWFRTDHHSSVDQTLFGYAFDRGPLLSLARDGTVIWRGAPLLTDCHYWYDRLGVTVIDGQWHHYALTAGLNFYAAYLDGRVLQNCSGSVDSVVRGSRLHLGVYDPEMHSANSMPFTGEVDDARLYRRLVLDEADLQENVMGRPPTPDELAHDLVLALDFDDDFDDNQITNKAVVSSLILVGGGLKQRSPLLVPSTAPLYGKSDNATIAIMAVQDGSSAPSVTRSLVAMSPRLTESRAMASVADIRIHQIVSTVPNSGVVSIGGVPLTSNMVLNSVANATITFAPSAGVVGVGLMRVYATLTIGAISQDFVVVVSSRANTHPIAGSAGMAAQFDGVDDFYMADHLAWPTKSVNLSGVRTRGLSAITIEFWAWFDETCTGDRAVFALGGNNERYNQWVDSFNALRRSGRWYLTLPDENGNLRWRVDMDEYTTSVTAYYGGWAHYALVHDGIDGVRLAVYINGVQVITDTHPHDGMQGGNLDFNHFTLGTWTFWSEVYHKGVLDEFRLWNYSRSEAEIRRDMYTRLTGAEPNLFAYWNFDDANDPNSDDVVDETRRGNTLRAGGCVSCEPRFYCQPYESVPGPPMDDNNCIPSAKDVTSIYYRTQTCFGGTHCFRGEERTSTHPTPVISEAPIGGFTFDQIGVGGEPVEIVLNGTDPDGDPLAFYIAQQPDRGLWQYETGLGGSWVPFPSAPFTLPIGVSRVRILTNVGDGGHPFAQLRYAARDAFALSATVQVQVQLLCPAGTYLNQDAHRCQPCAPGSYTAQPSTALACTLCPVNHAQPEPGQRSCQRCDPGRTYTTRIGSESCWACNTTSDQVNPALMSLSPTFCSMELVTDNVVATAGGFHSVLDFGALLANLPDADNHRVLLSTIPKHGKLLQVGIDGQLGEDFYDYVVSSIEIEEQYVARVVSATAWLPDRPYNATIGPPDAMRSGSSPLAWAPFANDNGVAQIVVAFEQAVYVTGVVVYENIGGGAVTLIEALDPDERWSVIWSGDPLPIGLAVLRQWQPVVCPTPFRTRTLRLTVNALRCSGRNEIDAIQLQGASELSKSRLMLISNPKQTVAYVPPSSVPLGYSFTDAISYQIQSCRGGDIIQTGVQSLAVKLGNLDVDEVTASSAAIWTAAVAGFVGIVTCLVSAIAIVMCRSKAVIRASSVVFMNIMVLGIATGFGVLLLSAMNAAAPDLLANFCMIRACMFSFAFVLIMGSIVVKTGRIVVIFNLSKGPRALHATNAHLALILFGLVAVDFAILSAGGMSPLLVDTYHISNTYRYRTCSGRGPAAAALIVVSIGYKAVLVVVGIALGVLSRNVPSAFNEVKALSIMTYTIATNSVLYLVVDGVIANPNTSLILITFSLSVSLLSAWISLVGYKFWVVVFRPDCKPNPSSESPVAGIIQQPEAVSKNSRLVTAGPKFNFTATMDGFRQSISGGDFDRYAHQ